MNDTNKKMERFTRFAILYWVAVFLVGILAIAHLGLSLIGLVDFNLWRFAGFLAAGIIMYLGWVIYFKIAIAIEERRLRNEIKKQMSRPRPESL